VIYPEQFQQEFDDTEIPPGIQVLGYEQAEVQVEQPTHDPAMRAAIDGASAVTSFFYDNRLFIRNTIGVIGGVYLLVKGPPIAAKSFAETMHYLREGWQGRGYENRYSNSNKTE
jgi:hypothetical protein